MTRARKLTDTESSTLLSPEMKDQALLFQSLFLLYKYNLHLIAKTGAQYNGYSVSRTFQLRENVRMLKYLIDIFLPIAVTTSGNSMHLFTHLSRFFQLLSCSISSTGTCLQNMIIFASFVSRYLKLPLLGILTLCYQSDYWTN